MFEDYVLYGSVTKDEGVFIIPVFRITFLSLISDLSRMPLKDFSLFSKKA